MTSWHTDMSAAELRAAATRVEAGTENKFEAWAVARAARRLAEVIDLHRAATVYEHADDCGHDRSEHDEMESLDGEPICLDSPTGEQFCPECTGEHGGELVPWPCETARIARGDSS